MNHSFDIQNENSNELNNKFDKNMKIALSFSNCGNYKDAIIFLSKSLELNNNVFCYLLLANCYYMSGDINKSIEIIKSGIKKNENNGMLYNDLGIYYFDIELNEEAFENFDIALSCPNYDKKYLTLHNIGLLLESQGEWIEAKMFYEQSLELNPSFQDSVDSYCKIQTLLN
jgi:Tfp pilus assembly protein PilF